MLPSDEAEREIEDLWALLRDIYHAEDLDDDARERIEVLAEEYERPL
jgi:hypothetical protein